MLGRGYAGVEVGEEARGGKETVAVAVRGVKV